MKKLVKQFGEPSVLTTDKAPALVCTFKKIQKDNYYTHTKHCTSKHRNNYIEQDHRYVKRQFIIRRKREVWHMTSLFRRIMNYRSYSEPLKL